LQDELAFALLDGVGLCPRVVHRVGDHVDPDGPGLPGLIVDEQADHELLTIDALIQVNHLKIDVIVLHARIPVGQVIVGVAQSPHIGDSLIQGALSVLVVVRDGLIVGLQLITHVSDGLCNDNLANPLKNLKITMKHID
jgi:hypothetical protein